MLHKAYMTVDDSPSDTTVQLTDFFVSRGIQALYFCRGDRLEENPEPVVDAIAKGMVMANHLYSHRRSSQLDLDEVKREIFRTEDLIDEAYLEAGLPREGKYIRFPHMDRGAGGWIVDYDAAPEYKDELIALFGDGLNIDLSPPPRELVEKKEQLQEFLDQEGFTSPFENVTLDWYAKTEVGQAIDCMFTYSTSDWMVTERHKGKWPYASLDDLKRKIDADKWLQNESSAHIILAHDQDELLETVKSLTLHFIDQGFEFIAYD